MSSAAIMATSSLNLTEGERIIDRFCRDIRSLSFSQRQNIGSEHSVELATDVRLLQIEGTIVTYCKMQTSKVSLERNIDIFLRCVTSSQSVDEQIYHEFYRTGGVEAVGTLVLATKNKPKTLMASISTLTVLTRARLARNLQNYDFSADQGTWLQNLRQNLHCKNSVFAINPNLQSHEERGNYPQHAPATIAGEFDASDNQNPLPPVSALLPHQNIPQSLVDAYLGLQNDVKYLVMLLAFLGETSIPLKMIEFVSEPGLTFNRTGEIETSPFGANTHSPPFGRSVTALRSIPSLVIVTRGPNQDTFTVQSHIREYVRATTSGAQQRQMKAEASRLVCRSFPIDEEAAPYNYLEVGRPQLPHVKHILRYFEDSSFCKLFSRQECWQFIMLCISASHFADQVWRFKAILIGESINTYANYELLAARLSLRELKLLRLYPGATRPGRLHPIEHHIQAVDVATNNFLGEEMLYQVQCLVDRGQLSAALIKIQKHNFKSMLDMPSKHEVDILEEVKFLEAKILRLQGNFQSASEQLNELLVTSCSHIHTSVTYHFVAVCCELGHFDRARRIISLERADERYPTWEYQTRGRRVDLATSEISMVEGLWYFKENRLNDARACLEQANLFYHDFLEKHHGALKKGFAYAMDMLAESIGWAVVAHMLCELSRDITEATWYLQKATNRWRVAWNTAERLSREHNRVADFTEVIILCSQRDIAYRSQTIPLVSEELRKISLDVKADRHLYWVGLGTLWYDILETWAARR